jgi:hypothetical protein
MTIVLSDCDFPCFTLCFSILLEQIVDIENQWLSMDNRFSNGKYFVVTAYYLCVFF